MTPEIWFTYGMCGLYLLVAARILWRGRVFTKAARDLPDGLGAMEAGYLLTCRLTREDVMAGILSLAQKGTLIIHSPAENEPLKFELQTIDPSVHLTGAERALDSLLSQYGGIITPQLLARIPGNATVMDDTTSSYFLNRLTEKVEGVLEEDGILSTDDAAGCLAGTGIILFFIASFSVLAYLHNSWLLLGVFAVAAVAGPASLREKRLTHRGVLARSKVLSLRGYVKKLAHVSKGSTTLDSLIFEAYLPFAAACGFGQKWCSAFAAAGMTTPIWLFAQGEWFGSLDSSMANFHEHVGEQWVSRNERFEFWNSRGRLPGTPHLGGRRSRW